ncbi:NUDIX domain-containing protein [Viridibacillus sp. FSL R5-0477]|uniref:NUDIX hydrolase n=1 Tax=Viridibacillus arenosi FSL R5-213 TaxID=1227360 RepID=W4EZ73_9BACL|nr:NUDIX domain-containing protein [Viridibacillus arenosi]ETT85367.1 NUDIX hydrolase [Viridibacillus arenosi FSL R5-213]OMC89427.1 NUDIX domain-containing protein [Viridibacillus arenosi]
MIRYAVGGIIKSEDTILLVKKRKVMDMEKPMEVKPEWDFPKGGIKRDDLNIQEALFRELDEETGTSDFRIIDELGTLEFEFPAAMKEKLGFERQVTYMFILEFLGDRAQLQPKTEEISEVVFVKIDEVDELLKLAETKEFFLNNLDEIKSWIVLR